MARLVAALNLSLGVLCNLLFLLAVVYALAVIANVLLPHTLVKVRAARAAPGRRRVPAGEAVKRRGGAGPGPCGDRVGPLPRRRPVCGPSPTVSLPI